MIQELKSRTRFQNPKLTKCYQKLETLLEELRTRSLSDTVVGFINQQVQLINQNHDEKALKKQVNKSLRQIIKLLEKEHKIVPKGHYRSVWMAVGMSAFGIPIGVAFGAALSNMAFMAMFMPIGMVIGIAIGTQKDTEAAKNGRQLDFQWG